MNARYLTPQALADLADVPARSRWIRSGAVRLHSLDYGGQGVPLVILPGITSPAITMDFLAQRLTDIARPIILDIRGRGLSDDGPSYTLEDYAADTEAVITELGLDCPILLGHSMGARIAAATAVRNEVQIRGTILVDPPLSGPGRSPYPTTLKTFRDQLAEAQTGTNVDEIARWWPRWSRREQELRARWLSSCGEDAIAQSHQGFETEDFFDYWPHIKVPTTLIYGGASPVVTPAGAHELAQMNSLASIQTVDHAGHMVFWDESEAAVSTLRMLGCWDAENASESTGIASV